MNQPELYLKYNDLQRNDVIFLLDNYLNLLKWKNDEEEAVLDIGCGPGDITEDLLLPKLPKNVGKLVGVDISEEMIDFAKSRKKSNKIFYSQFDLLSEEIPDDFQNSFDHVFSFYTLHWMEDQRKAMQNIISMIKPGGEMLLMILANHPFFGIYESLSKNKRWEPYISNAKASISPYHYCKNPMEELKEHLSTVGFKIHLCKIEERVYVYQSIPIFNEFLTAIYPLVNKIPDNQWEDYLKDYLSELKKLDLIEKDENRINTPYKLFIVHASKPI